MATIINSRSPFFVKVENASLGNVTLRLYIYEGSKKTSPDSSDLKYTISKSSIENNDYVVFEISELVRDYINVKYDGEYDSYSLWVMFDVDVSSSAGDEIFGWTSTPSDLQNILAASGTATGTSTNKLIDSSASFTSTVQVGDIAVEDQSGFFATVTSVDSNTTLTLDDNIYQSGSGYFIYRRSYFNMIATEGYGYFEEGINPEPSTGLLQSNLIAYRPEDGSINIPIFAGGTNSLAFYNNGELVRTQTISDNDNTDQKIQYIASSGNSDSATYEERVLESGGTFEDSVCLQRFLNSIDVGAFDEVWVNYDTGTTFTGTSNTSTEDTKTAIIKIKTLECSKYEPVRVTFVNKFGALQDIWFDKKSMESIQTKTESYKASVVDFANLTYNTNAHQMRTLNLMGNESIILNTGFIDDSYNEVIRQLMLSEQIWMTRLTDTEELVLPLKAKTQSVQYKTHINDKLVNYTIEFDMAFDKINNIR